MTYEYECQECGSILDVKQRITESPRMVLWCPDCGIVSVKRIISKTNFILSDKTPWAKEGYSRP